MLSTNCNASRAGNSTIDSNENQASSKKRTAGIAAAIVLTVVGIVVGVVLCKKQRQSSNQATMTKQLKGVKTTAYNNPQFDNDRCNQCKAKVTQCACRERAESVARGVLPLVQMTPSVIEDDPGDISDENGGAQTGTEQQLTIYSIPMEVDSGVGAGAGGEVVYVATTGEYIDVCGKDESPIYAEYTSKPWYVAQMDKAVCKAQVFGASAGDFLVRESRHHSGSYAVCVNLGDGKVQEDLITRDPASGLHTVKFCKSQSFPDLVSLVHHCQTHLISPKEGISLKLGQAAGVIYATSAGSLAVGPSPADSMYGCTYGEVDSGLLNFYNRIILDRAESYDKSVVDPLGSMAGMKPVSLAVALQTAETHCGSLDFAVRKTKEFAKKNAAKLITQFPKMTATYIEVILMYTADSELYRKMNASLGGYGNPKGRAMSVHYRQYAQLLISALHCLPAVSQRVVYRGVKMQYTDLLDGCKVGDVITWWNVISTTGSPSILRHVDFFDAVVHVNTASDNSVTPPFPLCICSRN